MRSSHFRFLILSSISLLFAFQLPRHSTEPFEFHENLSGYSFFQGPLNELRPAAGIIPYDLNSPLFSSYAEKLRFLKLPPGKQIQYNDSAAFDFPIGTVLIKNFFYYNDFRHPEKGRKIIETRLLALLKNGWATYQYIWNEAQTDAVFEPIGDAITVDYIDQKGKKITAPYVIPNQNQCKGCHSQQKRLLPIGLAARHLNRAYTYGNETVNQLKHWEDLGLIQLPGQLLPANANWQDPSASLANRARAYLDINCGFCHSPTGPANTSGLFLQASTTDPGELGINKTPVAAGRGSGNLRVDIAPGQPKKSILLYRMSSLDPGIAMPEIGREQVHKEGVALIAAWIKSLK